MTASAGASLYRRNLILAAVPTILVPVAIAFVLVSLGVDIRPVAFVAGAVGWVVALVLRAPVALVAFRTAGSDRGRAQLVITGASGPLEELVRLVVLLGVGRDLDTALSIGLGWAAIEVLYSLVNGVALMVLAERDDAEAEQARAMLPFQQATEPNAPFWGIVERAWASCLHIAFTLIVARFPALVVLTIPAHSLTNMALLRYGPRMGLARFQLLGAVWAAVLTGIAIALWRV